MTKRLGLFIILSTIVTAVMTGCGGGGKLVEQNSPSATQINTPRPTNEKSGHPTDTAIVNDSPVATSTPKEEPLEPEKNPPGDIPDSQVFVKYASASGSYEIDVPEGWARTTNATDVSFIDKFDGVMVKIIEGTESFSVENITKNQVAALEKSGRAVKVKAVKEVTLAGGPAVLVSYDSNSEPNTVTNKQVRLENEGYYLYQRGKLAVLTVWAPLGADNVDQWKLITNSFRWR